MKLGMRLTRSPKLQAEPGTYAPPVNLVLPPGCIGVMFVYESEEAATADGQTDVMDVTERDA